MYGKALCKLMYNFDTIINVLNKPKNIYPTEKHSALPPCTRANKIFNLNFSVKILNFKPLRIQTLLLCKPPSWYQKGVPKKELQDNPTLLSTSLISC